MPVIDRFEGDTALWEGGCAARALLPMAAREGDVVEPDGLGGYYVDLAETRARQERLSSLLSSLLHKRKPE